MIDPNLFSNALAHGTGLINQMVRRSSPSSVSTPSTLLNFSSNSPAQGFRTDRSNNPTAMTTDAARAMGLVSGVDYVSGDAFPNNPNLHTAKFLGDPIQTTIKAIDKGGFYTASGKPRWSYLNDIPNVNNWNNLDYNGKVQTIAEMYKHEGGNGSLMNGLNNPSSNNTFAFSGGGGPRTSQAPMSFQSPGGVSPTQKVNHLYNLGNITTRFGEPTKDTAAHEGTDIAAPENTPVPQMGSSGVVEAVTPNAGDYGNTVAVRNDDGTKEYYSHLHQMMVRPGQRVQQGQVVGTMGHTGNTWSPTGGPPDHLHLTVKDSQGNLIDPQRYLNS